MYSDKKNIQQLAALLYDAEIKHIVVCPGSRNAPLIQTLAATPHNHCYEVTDERSAGFFALGLIQEFQEPVAVCCTSGSALLNLAPAVAEAFYQPLPLLVISADRPQAWIGQMDGQTLPQPGVFNKLARKSVTLPEPVTKEDEWYSKRLINEALMALVKDGGGPVHINMPISEPLFNFTAATLPDEHIMTYVDMKREMPIMSGMVAEWIETKHPLIIIGQLPPDKKLQEYIATISKKHHAVVLHEHLSNCSQEETDGITHFDEILFSDNNRRKFVPDLVITIGGHIVSKRLKEFLRRCSSVYHWHFSASGEMSDLFQCLDILIKASPDEALKCFADDDMMPQKDIEDYRIRYWNNWQDAQKKVCERAATFTDYRFSDLLIVKTFLEAVPESSALQVANSSMVRNIQLFDLPKHCKVYCNRGINGIEGSLSTAVGYASVHKGLTFALTGDLSFFYDQNALWNNHLSPNLRVLLINNQGGQIFRHLPGLKTSEIREQYIAGAHATTAKGISEQSHCQYLCAHTIEELNEVLPAFISTHSTAPIILEVFTDSKVNEEVYKAWYNHLCNKEAVN